MRAIWSGSLSFGLINIPVKLYSASKERALKFRLLDRDSESPVGYLKVAKGTDKPVKKENIVRAYEYEKEEFVILEEDDFKKASPRKTKMIEVVSFVDIKEIDSKYFDKPYYIEPDKKSEKAYVLLREALKRSGRGGIARIVFKDREHIALIKPEANALMMVTLRYEDEIRSPEDLHVPKTSEFTQKEVDIALMLIDQLTTHFKASEFHDTYTAELQKIIEAKAKGRTPRRREERMPQTTKMKDLMDILKKSLEEAKAHHA